MEEEVGAKARVTRRRTKLSVEHSEYVKSPNLSTPTKKKGRLAAKPQLDHIDEDTPVNSPMRTTRKSIAREVDVDGKAVTPSRRSARIKSNTSIVSETTQAVESPRAKRAARRNSQLGSDNEVSLTPTRPTRRTRNTSVSSVDNSREKNPKVVTKQLLADKSENNSSSNNLNVSKIIRKSSLSPINSRKSPRLNPRQELNEYENTEPGPNTSSSNTKEILLPISSKVKKDSPMKTTDFNPMQENVLDTALYENQNESYVIKKINTSQPLIKLEVNKFESKRHRTKSWTTLTVNSSNDSHFYSDNESTKKKIKKSKNQESLKKHFKAFISGDFNGKSNNSPKKNVSPFHSSKDQTRDDLSNNHDMQFLKNDECNDSTNNSLKNFINKPELSNVVSTSSSQSLITSPIPSDSTTRFFESNPNADIKPVFILDDSDSDITSKDENVTETINEDQLVPVVEYSREKVSPFVQKQQKNNKQDDSCEPMDIDETLPENRSTSIHNTSKINESEIRRIIQDNEPKSDLNDNFATNSKSKRKSSLGLNQNKTEASNLNFIEKKTFLTSDKENKSTIILSESKDNISIIIDKSAKSSSNVNNIINNSIKQNSSIDSSSQRFNDTKNKSKTKQKKDLSINKNNSSLSSQRDSSETPSKSPNTSGGKQLKKIKNNLAGHNLMNTPSNKSVDKLYLHTSTPVGENNKKICTTNQHMSEVSSSSNKSKSDSVEEFSKMSAEENSLFSDGEAEEAPDDYESGDSRDMDEKEYDKEHEIIVKGETLTSGDDDISHNSDYEKDSFLVSSDEEDNELLSGSGDDLSMSDKELNMSMKAKDKYNNRMKKEQKQASREMFAARHGLCFEKDNKSINSEKSNRNRVDSFLLKSDDDLTEPKKKKRLRLDSSGTDVEWPKTKSKGKKTKGLLQSSCDEKEITVDFNDSVKSKCDPLSVNIKNEPQTPQFCNVSRVDRNDQEYEQVNVLNKTNTELGNKTVDPLQCSITVEQISYDEDNIVKSKCDSLPKNLDKKQNKILGRSLNYDKKTKKIEAAPIINELNLTVSKKAKKTISTKDVVESGLNETIKNKHKINTNKYDDIDSLSDSLDLQILFPNDVDKQGIEDSNISLKRSPGKLKINENTDIKTLNNSVGKESEKKEKRNSLTGNTIAHEHDNKGDGNWNNSLTKDKKKKNKRKGSSLNDNDSENEQDIDGSVSFFVDTVGQRDLGENVDKKNKLKKHNDTKGHTDPTINQDSGTENDDPPLEVLYISNKKKNSKLSKNNTSNNECQSEPISNTSKNKKKKKQQSEGNSQTPDEAVLSKSAKNKIVNETAKFEIDSTSKQKLSEDSLPTTKIENKIPEDKALKSKKRKRKHSNQEELNEVVDSNTDLNTSNEITSNIKKKQKNPAKTNIVTKVQSSKRKKRDEDSVPEPTKAKVFKENLNQKIHMTRFPNSLLNQLDENHTEYSLLNKAAISTSSFVVEETKKKSNLPSSYLEESIYLNDKKDDKNKKTKVQIKKPKVLPFMPTALLSENGFTTSFKISVIPNETKFVAQSSHNNFRNEYLFGKKIKRVGTYEMYKKHRNIKISKF